MQIHHHHAQSADCICFDYSGMEDGRPSQSGCLGCCLPSGHLRYQLLWHQILWRTRVLAQFHQGPHYCEYISLLSQGRKLTILVGWRHLLIFPPRSRCRTKWRGDRFQILQEPRRFQGVHRHWRRWQVLRLLVFSGQCRLRLPRN